MSDQIALDPTSQGYANDQLTLEALRSEPIPDFIPRDPFELKKWYVAKFEEITERTLYPAQPEMYVIEIIAYAHSILGEAAQLAFLQNRAIWAKEGHLEEVGANVSTYRLQPETAGCEVRFGLASVLASDLIIAAGKRVAAGTLIFTTTRDLVIPAGELFGDVTVQAAEAGASYNGLLPGQISAILDPQAHVSTVTNLQESGAGADVEDLERYRLRVVNALERISKAGPRQAYIEQVKAANASIVDVEVVKPQPGYIEITPLTVDGVSTDVLDGLILDYLDPETRVPMGDYISIVKAVEVGVDLHITARVSSLNAASALRAEIEATGRAVFQPWTEVLGAQLAPSAIHGAVKALSGVVDATTPGFDYRDLRNIEFARLNSVTVELLDSPNV